MVPVWREGYDSMRMDPKFVGSEAPAEQELLRHFEPSEIAECWGEFTAAHHGDNWER